MRAAVVPEPRAPIEVVDVELDGPRAGEVLVKIAASGVCASDLHVLDGELPEPFPIVLGHEAAGVVVETGPEATRLAAGDHVLLTLVPSCGVCPRCKRGLQNFCERAWNAAGEGGLLDGTSRLSRNGTSIAPFGLVGAFAEYAVVPESGAVVIPDEAPLGTACLISCAVVTGVGAVLNTAAVPEGASVAVWGCGGIGLNVVQGARLAGASEIVAVDVRPEQLELARRVGATATVHAGEQDTVEAVRELTGGGADYVFEALGRESTIQQAWAAAAIRGTVVVVGMMPRGAALEIDPWNFVTEKTLKGCFLGSTRIHEDIPRLVELYLTGELRLDDLVSRRLPLDRIQDAFDDLRAGTTARQVITFG
jgi:Zn-dependent alcohol dehydrogenase